MAQKFTALALLALTPALLLSACGGSETGGSGASSSANAVGEATCQDYADAVVDVTSEKGTDLMGKLYQDAGIDSNNASQTEALTYQMMDYCEIDVQNFLRGGDIQLPDAGKKLTDFTYVMPTPEATH